MKVIFLDIDGVLNSHYWNRDDDLPFKRDCIDNLNLLVSRSHARIVVSSAWRYLIGKEMTCLGFENLLRTHRFRPVNGQTIIDRTCSDEEVEKREGQILKWLAEHSETEKYVALDDLKLELSAFVKTNPDCGLTLTDVSTALIHLGCKPL